MSGSDLDPELMALEASLRGLEPHAQLSREAVLFAAGKASAGRGWLWPATAGLATAVAAILGWLLWQQSPSESVEAQPRVVVVEKVIEKLVPVPVPPGDTPPPRPSSEEVTAAPELPLGVGEYLRRRREVVRWGVEMLPSTPPQQSTGDTLTPAATPRLGKAL
jgi:hypothetical protein